MVLVDTESPGTSREIYSEDADGETLGTVEINCTGSPASAFPWSSLIQ